MMLIGPLIICSMFIMMVVSNGIPNIPATFAPLVWLGGVSGLAFMCLSLMTNVFGMDRNDFRCFVLMPVERSAILLGKNASVLPFVGVIAIVIAMVLYYVAPIGVLHLIGCFCQMLIVFFMASIVGNWTSILFPMAMAAGTGSPTNFKVTSVLVQMLVTFASPIVVVPGGLFFGIEWLISHYLSVSSLPVFAFLSVVECWFAYKLYLAMLKRQGRLLQSRETRILEFMTSTAE